MFSMLDSSACRLSWSFSSLIPVASACEWYFTCSSVDEWELTLAFLITWWAFSLSAPIFLMYWRALGEICGSSISSSYEFWRFQLLGYWGTEALDCLPKDAVGTFRWRFWRIRSISSRFSSISSLWYCVALSISKPPATNEKVSL